MDTYFAKFTEDDGHGYVVTFPDLPEANTGGESLEEAIANAEEALEVTLLTYAGDGKAIPAASPRIAKGSSYRTIAVPATVAAKIAFIIAFRKSGMTRVALAAKLGKAETEVRRMLDPYHQTKLGTIEAGLHALGKRVVLKVEELA